MNSTPRHPHRPRTSPYGSPRGGFSPSHVPPPPSQPYSTPVRPQHHYSPTPNFSTPPPPWSGGFPPPLPPGQFFTPSPRHLLPSPLSTSSYSTPLTLQSTPGSTPSLNYSPSPGYFYIDPDMPSPMTPPHTKKKRFAQIRGRDGRGRSGGRHHQNRSFRGGRGRGRNSGDGIDAYYDRFMLEDPWRDLLPAQGAGEGVREGTTTTVSVEKHGEAKNDTQEQGDSEDLEGKVCAGLDKASSPSADQEPG